MELQSREMTPPDRRHSLLDGRFAQGGMLVATFAAAAALGALYGPGPREAIGLRQAILPSPAVAADTIMQPAAEAAPKPTADTPLEHGMNADEEAKAREIARRKIAKALSRQAAEQAAAKQSAAAPVPTGTLQAEISASDAAPQPTRLGEQDLKKLADKAALAIRAGDIAGARLVLQLAVAAGDATAIYALAQTYDPAVLTQLRVHGMTGDPDKARALYAQALAKGVTNPPSLVGDPAQ